MIFYCESRIFSGQERMFLTAACSISKKTKCILIINELNKDGISFSKDNGAFVKLKMISNFNPKFSSLFVWFRWGHIYSFTRFLLKHRDKENAICISQGRIESGNVGMLAAKIARFKTISYIPMVHNHEEMGSKGYDAKLKNFLCSVLYRLPDAFITISDAVASELRKKCSAGVYVVENFVQQKKISGMMPEPPHFNDLEYYKLILPGRLLDKQKGQIDLIKAIDFVTNKIDKKIVCYIVGDGPDKNNILNEIKKRKLDECIYLLGNRSDLLYIMNSCNLVVLPSRFEGVPLVMLEAALLNKNIVASDIIGFNDYLYKDDLFQAYDPISIANIILEKIVAEGNVVRYKKRLTSLLSRSEDSFTKDFCFTLKMIKGNIFHS